MATRREAATAIPGAITAGAESAQWHETGGDGDNGSVAGTRQFAIASGATVDYVLACEESGADGGTIYGGNLTAIFTPAG